MNFSNNFLGIMETIKTSLIECLSLLCSSDILVSNGLNSLSDVSFVQKLYVIITATCERDSTKCTNQMRWSELLYVKHWMRY